MKPNLIFVLLDGTRHDRLHISKEFSELKNEGTLLNNVTAAAPYTFAATNSIFTGLFGKENGVNAYYKMFRLKDSVDFMPEFLQKNGYFTSCDLISNKVISKRGFDIHQSHDEYKDNLLKRHPDLIKKSLSKSNGKPIFCFLQFSRIHTVTVSEVLKKYDWDSQEFYDLKEKNLEVYDNAFIESGKYAKKIFETIKEMGIRNETILIFFSDHGTGVGERFGERNYGVFTYEETIRTVYLFIGPNILKNENFNFLLSAIDIFPTILELCKIDSKITFNGKSFASLLQENKQNVSIERTETFSETGGLQGPFPSPMQPNVFCIKTPKFKLIYFKTPEEWKLFDLINDPQEITNLYGNGLAEEQELKKKLLDWINR